MARGFERCNQLLPAGALWVVAEQWMEMGHLCDWRKVVQILDFVR